MTSEEDCPCTDMSEPSNVTSLRTDISSIVNSYESYVKITEEKKKTDEEPHKKTINQESPKATNHREMTQFEPVIPCYCHVPIINACTLPVKYTKDDHRRRRSFWSNFRYKWSDKKYLDDRNRKYDIKLRRNSCYKSLNKITNGSVKTKPEEKIKFQADKLGQGDKKRKNLAERIDIYYFDHGNSAYYRTTDSPPILTTEKCAEKTDQAATRFWAEIFGTIHIGTAFLTAFILQLIRFILFSLIRPLTVGILQLFADYFVKPLLSIIFNALIQPILILLYNIATSIKDLCEPLAETIGLFLREIANLCRSIRIIEIKYENKGSPT
ncbi:uncharacterized protein LOC124955990 isoform X1 [Vespa velutina]|uniref:uncharacterized protein LOC124955990 isoform X1 n=1 Tax=Vespa velutina TaxID=202808 RepID=UPI001FB5502A|nr:uncharacterized protein LOC124955990 isoform X1 [Vespa velutina]XP_047367235.1 uncharacterized protein LOC124955990 isoform X1 [Vespa velutina]